MTIEPIYTINNCNVSFKLYWTLSIFWRDVPIPAEKWFETLKPLTEKDGVRILEYRLNDKASSQFLISSCPKVSPSEIIRSVKGPLQNQIRVLAIKPFKRNYPIKSVGSAKHDAVQHYLDSQLTHHPMEIALCYLNNIAFGHGMKPVFEHSFYLGTFGEYDMGAIRKNL